MNVLLPYDQQPGLHQQPLTETFVNGIMMEETQANSEITHFILKLWQLIVPV